MLKKGGCGCSGGGSPPQIPHLPSSLSQPSGVPRRSSPGPDTTYTGGAPVPDIPKMGERRASSPKRSGSTSRERTPSGERHPSLASSKARDSLKPKLWASPLRQFDSFAMAELKRREIAEEDFPKLQVPTMKGQHKCKVQAITNHTVDTAIEMEQELRNIGIQETKMLDMLEKLTKAEAACRFQGAVRAAEVAAMSAPPELAEEAAVAGARGYTVDVQEFSKKSRPGENPIEIVGYIGCTRPNNF